ncbi:RAC serine/threonine-protein kinase [Wickerhamomyces ciferrii]|uniref:non-specific serine/threonine protein kinase n=1 Tax=Wickerhamomyces ciferrii (strain ATCC 14091 / BCRC 22168 / CBS 111 / JCM 3599 / NBRC 0793 / NRRL Y-1031 F-60-10) TaxID=1206466 RepID=K0KEE7_WICCF|nr:RAC serine/threonine-protein kinase [Wickerhamomyces ciferrii]CCH43510.1 RAC serine/threonine-protein kinase [Wickerhamomyces ciferrii]
MTNIATPQKIKKGLSRRYVPPSFDLNDEYLPEDFSTPQLAQSFYQQIQNDEIESNRSNILLQNSSFTPKGSISRSNLRNRIPSSPNNPFKLKKSKPYGQLQNIENNNNNNSNNNNNNPYLNRIFSENETSNFSQINGRRIYNDQKHRPHRTTDYYDQQTELVPDLPQSSSLRSFSNFYHSTSVSSSVSISNSNSNDYTSNKSGLEDEYIPDFDFSNTIQQWTHSYYGHGDNNSYDSSLTDSVPSSYISRPLTPVGQLHSQVSPVSVPRPSNISTNFKTSSNDDDQSLTNDEESVISKLPQDFTDLPFSVRRKLLADLSPNGNLEALNKIIKKKFKKKPKSSPAAQFLSSFSERSNKQDDNIILDHKLGSIIGFGAWGIIRECLGFDGIQRAMKIVRVKNEGAKEFFRRETNIWNQLNHENILKLINVKETNVAIFCLTERAYGGTLFEIVSNWGTSPSKIIETNERLIKIRQYCKGLLLGLQHMHFKGIVHGDVKLENCLIVEKNSTKIWLCDFGMSLRFKTPVDLNEIPIPGSGNKIRRPSIPRSYSGNDNFFKPKSLTKLYSETSSNDTHKSTDDLLSKPSNNNNIQNSIQQHHLEKPIQPEPFEYNSKNNNDSNIPHSHIGSLPYAAPELLEAQPPPLGPSADVWAFGILLYTMITGKLPFQHSFEPRLRAMISAGKYDTECLLKACDGDDAMYEAVLGCLTVDMNKRFGLDQVSNLINS